jgi:hypothetical protein
LWNLAARLEAAPFKSVYKLHFFRKLSRACDNRFVFNGGLPAEVKMLSRASFSTELFRTPGGAK